MKIALVSLSKEGARLAGRLAPELGDARAFLHSGVKDDSGVPGSERFKSVMTLTKEIFHRFDGIVFIMPCGAAVRAVAPHLKNKKTDPAVVVVDAVGRYAVSLLSGHEGGANDLAVKVGNILNAEPVITTTTEALKDLIIGIGCRRGVSADAIVSAVTKALQSAGGDLSRVRYLASADIKKDEPGLLDAARRLGVPIRFIGSGDIRSSTVGFDHSRFVEEKVKLPAVAEPAALMAGRRTTFILRRTVLQGVTVAVARENFTWSE